MSSVLSRYISQDFVGKGEMIFIDGTKYEGNFNVYVFTNGSVVGSIFLTKFSTDINERFHNGQKFSLIGELNDGLKISAESCVMYSISEYSLSHHLGTYVARFSAYYTKVFDEDRLKDLDSKRGELHFEVGILNLYSRYELSIQTEMCVIKTKNLLSEEEIAIVKNSFMSHISTVFTTKINNDEKTWKDITEELMATISKVLELSSFALATEHTWSYLKIYSDDPSKSSFVYSEIKNTLPRIPTSHETIDASRLQDFMNKSYQSYNDELNNKYNFSAALKWYLDSAYLRYDVMKYISASTAFESILDSSIRDEEYIIDKKTFKMVVAKLKQILEQELRGKIESHDFDSLLISLENINRRSYRSKAKKLLQSLGILDTETKEALVDIISVRNKITHTGRFRIGADDEKKVIQTYFKLFRLLTRIFLRILSYDADSIPGFTELPWQ
jgi:hypothetical protein